MKVLYIDTTSSYLYSCICDNQEITGEIKLKLNKDLSVFTLKKIEEMFNSVNLKPQDIDRIIVCNGPGSFTGIRIGVTIAKTYAWGLKKEVSIISSIEAMVLSSRLNKDYKVGLIDARRGYCYAGIYDKDNNIVMQDKYVSIEALKVTLESLPGDYSVITNDELEIEAKEEYSPNFLEIINYGLTKETINPHAVNPIYLKLTEAEEKNKVDII